MSVKALTFEDACAVVDLLILAAFPERRDVFFRDAFHVAVRRWPETDWPAVSRWLRSEEQDAGKVADALDAALEARPMPKDPPEDRGGAK